jgi:AcrR family transcriptional regulator
MPPRRPYRSPRRDEQRRATRAAIRRAARALFVERGYVATSVAAIADAAEVSPETVYATFGSKRNLLETIVTEAATGEEGDSGVLDADWFSTLQAEPDQRRRFDLMSEATRSILGRSEPVATVVREAAAADPDIAALWTAMEQQRHDDVRALVRLLAEAGALRVAEDVAVDLMWALSRSTDLYRALTVDRGWDDERAFAAVTGLIADAVLGAAVESS